MKLTDNQKKIYEAIRSYWEENHLPPRQVDLQWMVGWKWLRQVQQTLEALRKKGLIDYIDGQARSIRIVKKDGE